LSHNSKDTGGLVFLVSGFGILTTKMTTKMYTKLASIEINDEILTKVGRIHNFFGKNF
jgi:hypothetical protein